MATTATITDSYTGSGGDVTYFCRYDFDSGAVVNVGPTQVEGNAQAHFDAQIPDVEATAKEAERNDAFNRGMAGEDIDVVTWLHNTTAEIQTYFWRRFMNFLRDESDDPRFVERNDLIATAMDPLAYVNKPNNATIRGYIDDPAWANNDVGNALSKASALYLGVINLDHGEAELPL